MGAADKDNDSRKRVEQSTLEIEHLEMQVMGDSTLEKCLALVEKGSKYIKFFPCVDFCLSSSFYFSETWVHSTNCR